MLLKQFNPKQRFSLNMRCSAWSSFTADLDSSAIFLHLSNISNVRELFLVCSRSFLKLFYFSSSLQFDSINERFALHSLSNSSNLSITANAFLSISCFISSRFKSTLFLRSLITVWIFSSGSLLILDPIELV